MMNEPKALLSIPLSLAVGAFNGVSHSPEGRGARAVQGYESECAQDVAKLREQAEKGGTLSLVDEEIARYVAGYRRHACAYLASSSRCVSSFIAGPSNFPVRRMQKRNDIAHKRMVEHSEFRARALKAAIRNLRPDLRPIMSGDADAIERLEAELRQAERRQAFMAAANKIVRAFYKAGYRDASSGPEWGRYLEKLNELRPLSEAQAVELLKPDFCGRIGFADYELSNNGANVRRIAARIAGLQVAKAAPVVERESESGVRLEDDPPANRVRLFFPGKPVEAIRSKLKASGFRWAPSIGAWQAYRNSRAMSVAQEVAA